MPFLHFQIDEKSDTDVIPPSPVKVFFTLILSDHLNAKMLQFC